MNDEMINVNTPAISSAWRAFIGNYYFIVIIAAFFSSCSQPAEKVSEEQNSNTILMAKFSRPLIDIKYEASPERLARGKYLTEGLWCMTCHTERDETKPGWPPIMEKKFSGALRWKTDSAHLYAPNLTPDKETGIGNFTDDMLARAIREGVGHDGRSLVPAGKGGMPWAAFRDFTDEDLASIIVFLRSIPPIKNKIPKRKLSRKDEEAIVEFSYPLSNPPIAPDFSNTISRGKYLIGLSECAGCHTGWYARNPGIYGGGNPMGKNEEHVFSPNISADETGVGSWNEETFISVIRKGKGKSGDLSQHMPWVSYRNLSDEDLSAIYQALMTSFPVKHLVLNRTPISYCEVCEMEHGLGSANHKEPLKAFRDDFQIPKDLAGKYCSNNFNKDTLNVFYDHDSLMFKYKRNPKTWTLIPVSETRYIAEGFAIPLDFKRDNQGKIEVSLHSLSLDTFKRIE